MPDLTKSRVRSRHWRSNDGPLQVKEMSAPMRSESARCLSCSVLYCMDIQSSLQSYSRTARRCAARTRLPVIEGAVSVPLLWRFESRSCDEPSATRFMGW